MKVVPVHVGDVVKLKKPHPCGSYEWAVTKLGMDIGLECVGCGRAVRLMRSEFDRRFRGYVRRTDEAPEQPDPDGVVHRHGGRNPDAEGDG